MSMPQSTRLFRLQTVFGTQVYLDPGARLRHGPVSGNPDNIRVQASDVQLVLWYDAGTAGFQGVGFPRTPDGDLIGPGADQDGSEVVIGEPQSFEIESAGPVIGLRHHRSYVCSEPDGRVVVNRESFDAWERFTLIEVEDGPVLAAAPVDGPRIKELTIERLLHKSQKPEETDIEPPPQKALRNQAIGEPGPNPPAVARAEHFAASVVSIRSNPPPQPDPPPPHGIWRRLIRSLFG